MFSSGLTGPQKDTGEFRPRVRGAHVHNPDRLHARSGRIEPEQPRRLAILHATPEFFLGRQEQVLVERVGGDADLHPFAASGDDREHRLLGIRDPHVVLNLSHMLFGRGSFGEGPRQHELSLEDRPSGFDDAVEGRRHPTDHGVTDSTLNVSQGLARVSLEPLPIERLCHDPELNDKVRGQILELNFASFLPPKTYESNLIISHNDPGV